MKKKKPKRKHKKTDTAPSLQEDKRDELTEFGGIPNRDLKKNLGCG